jgi:hypothetical protein
MHKSDGRSGRVCTAVGLMEGFAAARSPRRRGDRQRDLATALLLRRSELCRMFQTASPPGEQATASQDQAGQAGTDDGAGHFFSG